MSEDHGTRRFPVDGELGLHEPEAHPDYAEIVAFFGHIAYVMPDVRGVLGEHLKLAEGEVLPTLMMQDLMSWLLETFRTVGPNGRTLQLFSILDAGYREASDALRDVMIVGFLEVIPGFAGRVPDPEMLGHLVRAGLGPVLSAVLVEVEGWRGDSIGT
ncbi:hypothetical protein [Demequina salsinemoris]|uniref:hypothetical protein n=1 Tax=Demequina salsinemoris TaxID=577470 RepID=UPI0007833758|nr:hypothetical protein [Demequina salsinemoris]